MHVNRKAHRDSLNLLKDFNISHPTIQVAIITMNPCTVGYGPFYLESQLNKNKYILGVELALCIHSSHDSANQGEGSVGQEVKCGNSEVESDSVLLSMMLNTMHLTLSLLQCL